MRAIINKNSGRVIACAQEATVEGNVVITEDGHIGFDENTPLLILDVDRDVTGYLYVDGQFVTPESLIPPTVSRVKFKMLWSSAERVATKKLRATDEIVADFLDLLDDPQTTDVVMALESVQAAIEYTLSAIKKAGVSLDVAARKREILSGVLK